MSKEIYEIREFIKPFSDLKDLSKNFEIIEKNLKAFEIIKNKQVDVGWFIKCYNDYSNDKDRLMMYNQLSIDDKGRDITKEDYDLLKEVLV